MVKYISKDVIYLEHLVIRENNRDSIREYMTYALNTDSKKADEILSTIRYKDVLDYEGKEEYPLCLLLNFRKAGQQDFFSWCCSQKIIRVKDLLDSHVNEFKEEKKTTQYKLRDIVATLIYAVANTELSDEILHKVNEENNKWEQVCLVYDVYPFAKEYKWFRQDLKLDNPAHYKIAVIFTIFAQMGVVTFDTCFDIVSNLYMREQKRSVGEKRKKRYLVEFFPNAVNDEEKKANRVINVNPIFYDLHINKGLIFSDLEGMTPIEVEGVYGTRVSGVVNEFFDVLTSTEDSFEESFLNVLKGNDRLFNVISDRSKGYTLVEIGKKIGVSQQRVRQLLEYIEHKYGCFIRAYSEYRIKKINKNVFDVIFEDETLEALYGGRIIKTDDSKRIIKIGSVYLKQVFYKQIKNDVLSLFSSRYSVLAEDVFEFLLNKHSELTRQQLEIIENELFKDMGIKRFGKSVILYPENAITRYISSIIIHDFFPDGMNIGSKEDYNRYKQIASDLFDVETPTMHCMQARIHLNEDVVMLDKAVYIHEDFIHISNTLSNILINFINKKLETSDTISVSLVFNTFEAELAKENIHSEYHLYGILRYTCVDMYQFRKFYIYTLGADSHETIGHMCAEYVVEHPEGTTKKELAEKFPGDEKSMFFTLKNEDVYFDYTSNKYFPYNADSYSDNFKKLVKDYLNTNMSSGFISCYKVFKDLNNACLQVGITDGRTLQGLCRKFFGDDFVYKNAYIQDKSVTEAISKEEVIKSILKDEFIPYKDLVKEFSEVLGLTHHRASTNLPKYAEYLFRYDSKVALKDYVHVPENTLEMLLTIVNQWFTNHSEMTYEGFTNLWVEHMNECTIEIFGEAYPMTFRGAVQILEWNCPDRFEVCFDGNKSVYYENAKIKEKRD